MINNIFYFNMCFWIKNNLEGQIKENKQKLEEQKVNIPTSSPGPFVILGEKGPGGKVVNIHNKESQGTLRISKRRHQTVALRPPEAILAFYIYSCFCNIITLKGRKEGQKSSRIPLLQNFANALQSANNVTLFMTFSAIAPTFRFCGDRQKHSCERRCTNLMRPTLSF